MSNYTLEKLLDIFHKDIANKWHPEGRQGNDGSAGNTLEDLLEIPENNLRIPDWGEIELKTKREDGKSLVTLLHREPKPAASVPSLLKSLGWRHRDAGSRYPDDELSFRSTTRANVFSDRGFSVRLSEDRIEFVFNPNNVNLIKSDKTKAYSTYGDWLDSVQRREPHFNDIFPIYWDSKTIEEEIRNKIDKTLFCLVSTKNIDGIRHFKYKSAMLFSGFDSSKISKLFDEQALFVDFDARSGHNHGTKFRIKLSALGKLFKKSEQIL